MSGRKRVAYFYDEEVGNFYYGNGHPMKPHRIRMTHELILCYHLYQKLEVYRPHPVGEQEMVRFHADDYVHFLQHVNPDNMHEHLAELQRYNVDVDCPVFDGLFRFCQLVAGGSIGGAYKLNHETADVVINWAGGLHHAKKSEASGFCYVNDIVLAILELLKHHPRVLYIDIDVHHGDGVEEAFYTTDRVMCVSFHKFGDYFPGTGAVHDVGAEQGHGYSLNFPLRDGIGDEDFSTVFKAVISRVMETFDPGAVVLQCGADSLTGDRLGCFNLTLKGHGACVEFMKGFNVPLLVLGGGGYTVRNVARCWAYETSLILNQKVTNAIPHNEFYEYYGPDFELHLEASQSDNLNTPAYLEKIQNQLFDTLKRLPPPSVQYSVQAPEINLAERDAAAADGDKDANPDERMTAKQADSLVEDSREFYQGDKDQDGGPVKMET